MIDRLKKIIKESGLSNRKFSESIGLSANAISEVVNGRMNLSHNSLITLSEEYGINIHWLLTGEGEMYLSNPQEGSSGSSYNKSIHGNVSGRVHFGNVSNQTTNYNHYETYENDTDLIILIRNSKDKKAELIKAIKKVLGAGFVLLTASGLVYWMVR